MRSHLVAVSVTLFALAACSTADPPPAPVTSAVSQTLVATTIPSTTSTTPTTLATTSSAAPSTTVTSVPSGPPAIFEVEEYPVPGSRPHDVAVAPDGTVWYTAQRSGSLDRLDPQTGQVVQVPLGSGAAPHGVIVGPDGHAWVTDQGLNALVRVDDETHEVEAFTAEVEVGMHTAAAAPDGSIWFTGQRGYVGRLEPNFVEMELYETGGGGPYGITITPEGSVYFAALSGSYIAEVDPASGEMTSIQPPTPDQGARRVWSDSTGRIWVSYWNTGHLAVYDPQSGDWSEWQLPGSAPQAYAVYVDEHDHPWVSDFGGEHALLRFDPVAEGFESVPLPSPGGEVRQLLGASGVVWGAESAVDALMVVRYGE